MFLSAIKDIENKAKKRQDFLYSILSIHVNISLIHDILNAETDKSILSEMASSMLIA